MSVRFTNFVQTGACPDWASWKKRDALGNITEAMDMADKWLNVSQVNCIKLSSHYPHYNS